MISEILFGFILFGSVLSFLVVLYNYFTAPIISEMNDEVNVNPLVSVLIPARNEEKNIGECIETVINQTYSNIEILVLDDNSSDNTSASVAKYKTVRLINGKKLPDGWLGKNWACHQLSENANGGLYLFIDADVRLSKSAIDSAVKIMYTKNVDMLSVFPTQIISNKLVYLIVPMMNWLLLSFLPLVMVFSSRNKKFVAANGQFILIKKEIYNSAGGHMLFKKAVVEDMEIARAVKENSNKLITLLGGKLVFCKMYSTISEAFSGFTKNYYPGFNTNPVSFLIMILLLQIVFTLPALLLPFDLRYLFVIGIIIISRILISIISRQSIIINVILHPVQMFISYLIGINSLLTNYTKKGTWKGRSIT